MILRSEFRVTELGGKSASIARSPRPTSNYAGFWAMIVVLTIVFGDYGSALEFADSACSKAWKKRLWFCKRRRLTNHIRGTISHHREHAFCLGVFIP